MTDLQASIGIVQLTKLDQFIDERAKWAKFYSEELSGIEWLRTPEFDSDVYVHGWQSYVTFVNEEISPLSRNDIMEHLQAAGIATRPGTHAVHMLNYYKDTFGIKDTDYPGAMLANNYSMSIPLHNRMEAEDYNYIVETLKAI